MQVYLGQDGICHATDPSRITDKLREKLSEYKPQEIGDEFIAHPIGEVGYGIMMALCDSIDVVHANLERENAELKAELDRVTGEQEEHQHSIGCATVTIKPTLDWTCVARELRAIADTLAGDAS